MRIFPNVFFVVIFISLATNACAQTKIDLAKINLPPGFEISVFARMPNARSMAVVPELNAVFVGNRQGSSVYMAIDADGDGRAEQVAQIASGLTAPNGVAWKDGHLYIAEQHRIFRVPVPDIKSIGSHKAEIIFTDLPNKSWHGWRYIAFDAKGRLHVTIGSPCNICKVAGNEGTIIRLPANRAALNQYKIVARGVRNSVGLDFHPKTGELFFTDNGADNLGDDVPPDELNHATGDDQHFGFPYFGGGTARTPNFSNQRPPQSVTPPVVAFNAHVAALGIHFYRGNQFPANYRTDAFVAQHGSWNRTVPDGYRVMRIRMDENGRVIGKSVFADGWLQRGSAWGRPVDVAEWTDGSLLVSDDRAGAIYRISYRK